MPTLHFGNGTEVGLAPYRFGQNLDTKTTSFDLPAPAPADMVTIADAAPPDNERQWGVADGFYAVPERNLFTYDGRLARAYADGHIAGGDSTAVRWIATSQRTGQFQPSVTTPNWLAPWYDRQSPGATW